MERIIVRPVPVQTLNVPSEQKLTVTECSEFWYLDLTAIVNGGNRLIGRFKFIPENVEGRQRFKVELFNFLSEADQEFTAGQVSTPFTEGEADHVSLVGHSPFLDLDAFYTAAGDVVS